VTRTIALLRGINVTGRHIVPMKELIRLMEADGYTGVKTYIQSGNVVFDSAARPATDIGRLIEAHFGFKPAVLLLNGSELQRIIENNPYQSGAGNAVHIFFFDREPESVDHDLLRAHRTETEEYEHRGKVLYLHTPDGIGRSKLAEKIGKAFPGVIMSARNLNTVNKLVEMLASPAE